MKQQIDQTELRTFLRGPVPRLKFTGFSNIMRMAMEKTVNRGPTPEELQAFVKKLREGRQTPKVTVEEK